MSLLKNTSFLDAVAAAIQHEKDCFDFYLRMNEEISDPLVKELFQELAEDVENHLILIEEIYQDALGGKKLPNLKQLAAIHKFHSTTIQKFMRKLDRNTKVDVKGDALDAIQVALREGEDARDFYAKMRNKFSDPNVRLLFQRLSYFNEENRALLQFHYIFLKERLNFEEDFFWNDLDLIDEANESGRTPLVIRMSSESIQKKGNPILKKRNAPVKKKTKLSAKSKTKPKTKPTKSKTQSKKKLKKK
ncbi:MAG: ferritin family protein [Leptospiraceae bacterium]|nr:ferritin family protein [Leptospiraceae bacterium]MCK6382153.1 ferritin family protein [Leptospiraceae bacterium]